MQFQLSVYYHDAFLSYVITSADKTAFHFQLKSKPATLSAAMPDDFTVNHPAPDQWVFEKEMDKEFEQNVIKTLKKTKL